MRFATVAVSLFGLLIVSAQEPRERGVLRPAAVGAPKGEPWKAPKYALVIGIDRYSADSGFGELDFSVSDAIELSKALVGAGYKVETLHDKQASRTEIIHSLQAHLGKLKEEMDHLGTTDGIFIFAFAGHGVPAGSDGARTNSRSCGQHQDHQLKRTVCR